jgi:starch phosphorylase
VRRVRRSLTTLGPFVTASRMVRDYTEQLYEPAAAQGDALTTSGNQGARDLAAWKARVTGAWDGVHVDHLEVDGSVAELGATRTVEAVVALGDLTPDDVEVQLLHGPAGQGEEMSGPAIVPMRKEGEADDGHLHYAGSFTCESTGRYGVTVRIVPAHPDLSSSAELGRIAWG